VRVVLWGELFWPYIGGAELFAAHLIRALRPRGFEFTVITSHDSLDLPDEDTFDDTPVHRFPFRRALSPAHLHELLALRRRVGDFLSRWNPQVVHINGVTPSAFFCINVLRARQTPLLVRLNQEMLPHQFPSARGTLLEHTLQRADWVTSVSTRVLQQARELVPDIAGRSSVIYNGVAAPTHLPPPVPATAPILCVGRLVPQKGFALALAAFAAIRPRWPQLRLIFAGDGPERASLQQQAHDLGIADAVTFLGWVAPDAVSALLATAAMLVLPSVEEGLPNVAIQASAMAVPLVSTSTGGLPEVVRHGETGLLTDPTADAVAAAMTALLADTAMARRLGINGWRRAREVFGQQRCVEDYAALYRRLADRAQ
jgi:glycosyltransferase involved in cell wall biosynthesis